MKTGATLEELQLKFNGNYPNLWIDFYWPPFAADDSNKSKISPRITVDKICPVINGESIDFSPGKTVEELKVQFIGKLGIVIQLLRRSGNVWVSTYLTEKWTLGDQNFQAEQIFID